MRIKKNTKSLRMSELYQKNTNLTSIIVVITTKADDDNIKEIITKININNNIPNLLRRLSVPSVKNAYLV